MNCWALGLSYDGTPFHGWQLQSDVPSVQGELESALAQIAVEPIRVHAAGRTDRGVHATSQVVGFHTNQERSPKTWLRGLNGLTSESIRVQWVRAVDADFHARYSAVSRRYHYVFVDQDRYPDPLLRSRAWHCGPLDADVMHRSAQALLGEQDFTSFRAAGCQSTTPMRRVNRCTVTRSGCFVVMEIQANAFLLHMVRNIASGLHDVGRGTAVRSIADTLALKDRAEVGITAPPGGLYFTDVAYSGYDFPRGQLPTFLGALNPA
ncbi:MAG: tRNA pseudouridine(38-40) synthase TruA [Pseudomonadales bacterium]|nr:tRNA pseudouridine(38-40) synthase TruA [Pseudomonadales bacterium]